jgi:hypothetical protein
MRGKRPRESAEAQFSLRSGTANDENVLFSSRFSANPCDGVKDANHLAGTGFNDGQLILSGTIVDAAGVFLSTGDGRLRRQRRSQRSSILGTEGTAVTVRVDSVDPSFFQNQPVGSLLVMDFGTENSLNVAEQDPSALTVHQPGLTLKPLPAPARPALDSPEGAAGRVSAGFGD